MTNYIIGGGLAGLVTGFYNPEYKILDAFPGKMCVQKFSQGPHYIWHTPYTKQLMKDLEIDYNVKFIKIGYLIEDDTIHSAPSFLAKKRYFAKSRCLPIPITPSNLAISESKSHIKIINVDMKDLISALLLATAAQQITSNVTRVDLGAKLLGFMDNSWDTFEHLVSTIPAPDFRRLCTNGDSESNYLHFYWSSKIFEKTLEHISLDHDIIYDCRRDSPISRYTEVEDGCILEYNIDRDKYHLMSSIIGSRELTNYDWMFYGQIQCDWDIGHDDTYNIDFIGRLAQWKHGIKLQDIIKDARNLNAV